MLDHIPFNNTIKIFLAASSDDVLYLRKLLQKVLQKAGMQVLVFDSEGKDEDDLIIQKTKKEILTVDCSIHLLGNRYTHPLKSKQNVSLIEYQLNEARKRNEAEKDNFRIFLWHPSDISRLSKEPQQEKFINKIKYNIFRNMVFSVHDSPVIFAEDVRNIMNTEAKVTYATKDTDIYFISNEIDEDAAAGILDLLNDIARTEKMNIIQNSEIDYSELASQQINRAKLTVIFFKRTADWALPFAQQIWKKIGGASSSANILLIGDGNHEINQNKIFDVPRVTSLIISEELIPLEIKAQYDKLIK